MIKDTLHSLPNNPIVQAAAIKTEQYIKDSEGVVSVSVSGGSDSDIMVDLIERVGYEPGKVRYVWFDTGLEYEATKKHLLYLEDRYGIYIDRRRAKKPVPVSCSSYGQPFYSKIVAMYINRLQNHNFQWEDGSYEDLVKKYPKCQSALRWWCNAWGEKSRFNIEKAFGLKEFMLENPPDFKISDKCCEYAKKAVAHQAETELGISLSVVGVRRGEGGKRAVAYNSCFSPAKKNVAQYRPLFWFTDEDKKQYEAFCNIKHSACYSMYGLKRTGCACCPFGSHFVEELEAASKYEPKLYLAAQNIFGKSYSYTLRYRDFKKNLRRK